MKELDLHGVRHVEAALKLENWILKEWENRPLKIIYGNSNPMKKIVMEVVDKYDLKFFIPAYNLGCIHIIR